MEENLEPTKEVNNEISDINNRSNSEELKDVKSEKNINLTSNTDKFQNNSTPKVDIKNENAVPAKTISKPIKELPIEKKPFQEFINIHLIPSLIEEINQRGLEVNNINLENTNRPIAGDKCWVVNCEIKDTCSFWLSFEKEDISSSKSISLSKPSQKPSIIESFLIDEKRITLKLIISRVMQRLNGQKLIGVN
ncbi:MAG: DUF2996 domain-containing protein [Prochlorococcus marinus CUG1434]|nr:DUF2996 domain-containing protein [Prochlorococcus marinus CUG1434]